ncbi:hypothetical protein HNP29_003590 [Pseudomonas alcaligenes]|nr:hypothetical protein [Pseudomonas alcaligenes]
MKYEKVWSLFFLNLSELVYIHNSPEVKIPQCLLGDIFRKRET